MVSLPDPLFGIMRRMPSCSRRGASTPRRLTSSGQKALVNGRLHRRNRILFIHAVDGLPEGLQTTRLPGRLHAETRMLPMETECAGRACRRAPRSRSSGWNLHVQLLGMARQHSGGSEDRHARYSAAHRGGAKESRVEMGTREHAASHPHRLAGLHRFPERTGAHAGARQLLCGRDVTELTEDEHPFTLRRNGWLPCGPQCFGAEDDRPDESEGAVALTRKRGRAADTPLRERVSHGVWQFVLDYATTG